MPARDEAQRIAGCLRALDDAAARTPASVHVLILVNDRGKVPARGTAAAVRAASFALRHVAVAQRSVRLPDGEAHAGGARRRAVAEALAWTGARPTDRLLTTDADARLDPDGFVRLDEAFACGAALALAEIVCIADPFDPVPQAVIDWGTPEVMWRHRVRHLAETIRLGRLPERPCHDDYGGAGIAATVGAYRALGGFPAVPSEEDLRFVRAADEAGLPVDRGSGAIVRVLARATGRAEGGMASALAANAAALAHAAPRRVERHDLTLARLRANPSPARVFCAAPAATEPVHDALRGIDRALAAFGPVSSRIVPA